MTQPGLSAVDVHALHQQARGIMAGIQALAHDISSNQDLAENDLVIKGLDQVNGDLWRLKEAMAKLKTIKVEKTLPTSNEIGLPSLLGGMALGVVLGKFLGSKLQLDLLPFLVGLDLVTGNHLKQPSQ